MSNFTNSPLISHTRLSPHRNSPRNQRITKITIHHQAGNMSLAALGEFLSRPATRASYNYGIASNGDIGLFVNERDRCWGSSSAANDNQAVVIGVANNSGGPNWTVSAAAFASLIRLCVDICRRNPGIVQINGLPGLNYNGAASGSLTRHNMFAATLCPGPYLQRRFPEIVRLVNAELNREEEPDMTPEQVREIVREELRAALSGNGTEPSGWAREEMAEAIAAGITDGTRPLGRATREEVAVMNLRTLKRAQGT